MIKNGIHTLLFVLLVIIPSCAKKTINKQDNSDPAYFFSHNEQLEDFDLIEKRQSHYQDRKKITAKNKFSQCSAVAFDFPIALDAYGFKDVTNDSTAHCVYNTQMQSQAVIDFYCQEMEYAGWQETFVVINQQSIALFTRPTKICLVHCNAEKSKRVVSVWLGTTNS